MSKSYRIPYHVCQWCYKKPALLLFDCMCIACKDCFQLKGQWVTQQRNCYFCQKKTMRKFIDLKVNPEQGRMFFHSFEDISKINQFQHDATKKYCKHLEKRIKVYQNVINSFLTSCPQYRTFFEKTFNQLDTRPKASNRSKSNLTFVQNSPPNHIGLIKSHTQSYIQPRSHIQNQNNNDGSLKYNQKIENPRNISRKINQAHKIGKSSMRSSIVSRLSNNFQQDQQQFTSIPSRQFIQNIDNKTILRNNTKNSEPRQKYYNKQIYQQQNSPSNYIEIQRNQKKSVQISYNQNQKTLNNPPNMPVFRLKGKNPYNNNHNSDSKNQPSININLNTAKRSIRSQNPNQINIQEYDYLNSPVQKEMGFKQKKFHK